MRDNDGVVSVQTNMELATKAFTHTHYYDGAISTYLKGAKIA
jgi:AICAR transformylase/IMP cyclohydrolase PurH